MELQIPKFRILTIAAILALQVSSVLPWGLDGHTIICRLAQSRLSETAAAAVEELLPAPAERDLSSECLWADGVKFHYHWSRSLHYINTPDELCTYQHQRDCKDEDGEQGRCVAGAIANYTSQLLNFSRSRHSSQYNLTEALLFLSHFMGDIHQPLHVGFTSDRGANTINVYWYTRKQVLHHVWDTNIIETEEERFFDSSMDDHIEALNKNITTVWANEAKEWEACGITTCPDLYASEGIKAACDWAYKGVEQDPFLEDDYFLSRRGVVNIRLAQAAVRLAATLNRIFA